MVRAMGRCTRRPDSLKAALADQIVAEASSEKGDGKRKGWQRKKELGNGKWEMEATQGKRLGKIERATNDSNEVQIFSPGTYGGDRYGRPPDMVVVAQFDRRPS